MNLRVIIPFILILLSAISARANERLSELQSGNDIYSNVTVLMVSDTDVYFTYDNGKGMANAKLKSLSPELQKHFHYNSATAAQVEQRQALANAKYLHQVISQPPPPAARDSEDVRSRSMPDTYGDVPSRYKNTTVTRTGDVAPISSIRTIDGRTVDFHGKVVLLDFFADWCAPCREEMPYVQKYLWQQFKSRGLIVAAVGYGHSKQETKAFQQQNGYSFPFVADPNKAIYHKFATQYIPRCVLIGRDGRIKCQTVGFSSQGIKTLIIGAYDELQKRPATANWRN